MTENLNQLRAVIYALNPITGEMWAIEAYGPTPDVVRNNIAIALRPWQQYAASDSRDPDHYVSLPDEAAIEQFLQHKVIIEPAPA